MEAILPLRPDHLPALREIARESFPVLWAPKEFLYFLGHPLGINLGMFEAERLDGYIMGLLVHGELDIVSIATSPAHRKRGKAERLLRYVLELPQIEKAFLEVEAGNTPAEKLYEKLGFVITGVRRKYYRQTNDAHLMKWQRS